MNTINTMTTKKQQSTIEVHMSLLHKQIKKILETINEKESFELHYLELKKGVFTVSFYKEPNTAKILSGALIFNLDNWYPVVLEAAPKFVMFQLVPIDSISLDFLYHSNDFPRDIIEFKNALLNSLPFDCLPKYITRKVLKAIINFN